MLEIATALTALKSMAELTKLIIGSKVDAAVREKAIELQSVILSLNNDMFSMQVQHGALLQAKQELEQKIAKLEQWETEATRYELKEIASAVFVYATKPESTLSEPAHWLCPNCYQHKQTSILQRATRDHRGTIYVCQSPSCKTEIIDHSTPSYPPAPTVI